MYQSTICKLILVNLKHLLLSDLISAYRYRWVSIQLDYLCTLRLPSFVYERLGRLPLKLATSYDELCLRKSEHYEDAEKRIIDVVFCWLLAARSRLTTAQFVDAISVAVGRDAGVSREAILDLCFNLVIIDKALDVFRFAHLSVQEYIESKSKYEISQAHATVAIGCLSYLSENSNGLAQVQYSAKGTPLCYSYACRSWASHLQHAGSKGHMRPVLDAFFGFCAPGFLPWTQYIGLRSKLLKPRTRRSREKGELFSIHRVGWLSDPTPIYIATALGMWEIFELEGYNNLKCFNRFGCGPLTIACKFNQIETVRWLLNRGADPNEQDGLLDDFLLAASAAAGNLDLARILIEHGAFVKSRTRENGRALCIAIHNNDLDMAKLLLDGGISVDLENVYLAGQGSKEHCTRKPPLFYAEKRATIDFLLKRGASPYQKDHNGLNVLEHAICLGLRSQFDYWIDKDIFKLNDSLLPLAIKFLTDDPASTYMMRGLLKKGVAINLDLCRQSLTKRSDPEYTQWVVKTTFLESELKLNCNRDGGTWDLVCDACVTPISSGIYMRKTLLSDCKPMSPSRQLLDCCACQEDNFDLCLECYKNGARCQCSQSKLHPLQLAMKNCFQMSEYEVYERCDNQSSLNCNVCKRAIQQGRYFRKGRA